MRPGGGKANGDCAARVAALRETDEAPAYRLRPVFCDPSTASSRPRVGAWLGQTYAKYQARRQSIENLVHLVYERRTRAGMVSSALRRGADIDEVRYRKRAYDEAYVDWNKNVMQNIFAIREVTGEHLISGLEKYYEDGLVAAMADVDRCLTKAYDTRLANGDAKDELEACRMAANHQFVLDCGATFTNELYKLTKLSFLPFGQTDEGRATSEKRIKAACTRMPAPPAPAGPAAAAAGCGRTHRGI